MHRINKYLPAAILVFVVLFHAVLLLPEPAELSPSLNDDVLQYSLCVSMKGEIESGGNPIDHWVPYWSTGFPIFHYYQHLPHLMVVLIYFLLFKKVSLFFVYHLILYLLLVFYPLVIYFSLRSMGLSMLSSAAAALFSLALSNINNYGFELGSYIFRGLGLFNQVWVMVLFPITMSSIYRTIIEGKGYARSVFMLFLLTISQIMFGMIAIITSFLFLFNSISLREIGRSIKRLGLILFFFFIATAYFFIPVMMDNPYYTQGVYGYPERADSYGPQYIITHFLNGDILDNGRIPVVTVLAVVGLIFSLSRRPFIYKWAGAGFILWFLLYFGRPFWGSLIDIIPLSSALQMERFVAMVHFFSAILAGIGLSFLYQKIRLRVNSFAALALIIILICPVFWERFLYLKQNNEWLHANKVGYLKEKAVFEPMLEFIKKSPPGRTYPGRRVNWGNDFKIGNTAVMYLLAPKEIPSLGYFPGAWDLPADFALNFNEYEKSYYDLFNIRYVLASEGKTFPSFVREIHRSGRFRLYGVETTGYFDLVESPIAVYGDKVSVWNITLLWLRSPMMAEKQHLSVFFNRAPHKGYRDYLIFKDKWAYWNLTRSEAGSGRIAYPSRRPVNIFSKDPLGAERFSSVSPGRVISENAGKNVFTGKVSAEKDCFLLFKMSYHPGWNAYIDGKETEKVILSPGFVGVKIKKGVHQVKFVYSAQKWKMPLLYAGLIIVAGLFLWERICLPARSAARRAGRK